MGNEILLALWITMLFVLFNETHRLRNFYNRLQKVNRLLEMRLMGTLGGVGDVSVFLVRDIRTMLDEEFVKSRLIDSFELYRVDAHNLHMKLRKEEAEQEFEIHVEKNRFTMREVAPDGEEE